MDSLKTIEGKVRAVLQENEDARNDDMVLYLALCNLYLKDAGAMPLAQILLNHKELGLPSFESVGRTRRKLQEKYPELLGSVRMQKIRAKGEKAYRRYAKESLGMVCRTWLLNTAGITLSQSGSLKSGKMTFSRLPAGCGAIRI